jgi:hypothetical protein
MPRASTKRQPGQAAANQRDTRHENGLVGPGKRVIKQKSNGHLNGHAKASESLPPTPPLPGTPLANGHVHDSALADNTMLPKIPVEAARRTPVGTYSESSESESYSNAAAMSASHENHRRIDVNAAKNPAVHRDVGPLSLALTVLRACPLYDTIAILIVLLQLPPTFLTIIHVLFATLTFVPPSNIGGMGYSFIDVFEGRVATPSVATIVVVDLLVLLVWLFLWSPLQDIALDLAQSVIALTLGGAHSGRETGMRNVFVCFGIIGANHFAHVNHGKQLGLKANLSSLAKGYLGSPDLDDPLEPISSYAGSKKSTHGWIQSILAIHILTQGAVRYIRDWYVRREKRDISTSIGDPEAGKGTAEASIDTSNVQLLENDSSTSLLVSGHGASSKQRKKQIQQLRTRQPLWAALASTKIVMVKEYETSSAAVESAGTNATDINNLGNAPFDSEADRIWVTFIGSDSIYFSTSYFPHYTPPPLSPPESSEECRTLECEGADKAKPFYVRVNNSPWQPTRIYMTKPDVQQATQETRWEGEIYGLAPISSYTCDFISTVDGTLIFSTSVRTRQPQLDVASVGLAATNPTVAGRPGSPTTTLKTSIATSEVKLAEEKNRQKRERKDQRVKLSSVRKDLEKLASNISHSGGNDDKLRQKIQQSNLHMKQAEDALDQLAIDIQALSTIPIADEKEYRSSKKAYQLEKEQHKELRSEFEAEKLSDERDLQVLSSDLTSMQQKNERMQARIIKLNGELERITDANLKGLNEAQRIATDREYRMSERASMERMLLERLQNLNDEIADVSPVLEALANQVQLLLTAEVEMYHANAASPGQVAAMGYGDIPEPSNSPWNPGPSTASLYAPPPGFSTSMMQYQPHAANVKRGRSSSMLSNVSGFTQSSGEGPIRPIHPSLKWMADQRKGSSGSGSASVSGSGGSVGDPKSPIGNGNGKALKWPIDTLDDK